MNSKVFGRDWSWPNLRFYPGICLEKVTKTMINLSQGNRSLGRNWILGRNANHSAVTFGFRNCIIQGYSKRSINFQKFILQVLLNIWRRAVCVCVCVCIYIYIDWRENFQRYFHTLQTLDVSPTCDAADVKLIIQLFPHSSQHVTGNSGHSLSDAPLQIIDIRTLRHFLSIRTQDMDLVSVVFVK
jgi:hypothetical protein